MMEKLALAIHRILRDEEGVTAIEYGLIAALIAVVILATVAIIGTQLNIVFKKIADCLTNIAGGTSC